MERETHIFRGKVKTIMEMIELNVREIECCLDMTKRDEPNIPMATNRINEIKELINKFHTITI